MYFSRIFAIIDLYIINVLNMKKILVFTSLFFLASTANAAELMAPKNKENPNFTISASEQHKNLYAAAPNLTVNSKTLGDLTAAGGTVTLIGEVENGLLLAGGNLSVSGPVGGNARIAGGNINISTSIMGDLVVVGGNVTISQKASIGGDLILAAGNVILEAPVAGKINFVGGNLTVNSKVSGGINARLTDRLVFGPQAEVLGNITYKAPVKAVIDTGAKLGPLTYNPAKDNSKAKIATILTAALVIKLLAWMLASWLLLKLRKKRVLETVEIMQKKPWESLGFGLLALVGWPIVTVLVLLTAVGYYVAIILALVYVLLLLIGALLSALFVGHLAMHYLTKASESVPAWQTAVLGVVLWQLIKFIPIVGWLTCAIIFLMVLGAMVRILKHQLTHND
jgi:hypothetical protein